MPRSGYYEVKKPYVNEADREARKYDAFKKATPQNVASVRILLGYDHSIGLWGDDMTYIMLFRMAQREQKWTRIPYNRNALAEVKALRLPHIIQNSHTILVQPTPEQLALLDKMINGREEHKRRQKMIANIGLPVIPRRRPGEPPSAGYSLDNFAHRPRTISYLEKRGREMGKDGQELKDFIDRELAKDADRKYDTLLPPK